MVFNGLSADECVLDASVVLLALLVAVTAAAADTIARGEENRNASLNHCIIVPCCTYIQRLAVFQIVGK